MSLISKIRITLLVIMMVQMVGGQPNCPGALTSLTPCLSISVGNSSTPSSSCCTELANMLETAPVCLCDVLNGSGGEALGVLLNRTLASALPTACNIQTPPVTQCNGLGNPSTTDGDGAYSQGFILKMPLLLTIAASLFRFLLNPLY